MKRVFTWSAAAVVGVAAVVGAWRSMSADREYVSHFEGVMGTSVDISVLANSASAGRSAEQAVLEEIARESRILSGYDPDSEFSRWTRTVGVPTRVSPELVDVLADFDEWRGRTSGALDPAAEAIGRVWKRAAGENRLPSGAELQAAIDQVHRRHWEIDRASAVVTRTSDVPVVLNSFTKSFIVDRAARRALAVSGVRGVLVNAGGDVVVRGDWTRAVGVGDPVANADNAAPLATLSVRDAVVATSGSTKRGFDIRGRHYSHVVDPRTGQTADHVLSATVVSRDAVEAGALATALCVLTAEESAALVRTRPGVQYALVLQGGRRVESPGWRALEVRPRPALAGPVATLAAADQATWNTAWQLTISVELARVDAMARRPYVAVWVEDKDHFPVRTIALWYDGKARWLPDLRAWYRADRMRWMAEGSQLVDAVTTPTRSPGKYTLQWDGKDNAGKLVRAGAYTICIEASREHGTYQIIRQEMTMSGKPLHVALPGGTEISAASFDYQPAAAR
jgi:FAD:protein FMN transferase